MQGTIETIVLVKINLYIYIIWFKKKKKAIASVDVKLCKI